jgi:hypothetical protein
MSKEELRTLFEEKQRNRLQDPLGIAQEFLNYFWGSDNTDDENRQHIISFVSSGAAETIQRELDAVELLLSYSENDDDLVRLVIWEANEYLEVEDGPHARAWLRTKSDWVREIFDEALKNNR